MLRYLNVARRTWCRIVSISGLCCIAFTAQAQWVAEVAAEPEFPIATFVVEGATVVNVSRLQAAAAPFAGPQRRFADIERARAAVQQVYIDRGYGAVQVVVPEQEITGGEVRLRVIEARLNRVEVVGGNYHNETNIRRSLPQLQEGSSPNTVALSRSLALANRSPAKDLVVSMGGAEEPGEIAARVVVRDDKPWQVTLGADNTGTPQSGTARASIGFRHSNLFNRDQQWVAQFVTAPENVNDVEIWGTSYRIPLYGWGDSLQFAATYSNVNSGSVAGFAVSGRGSGYGTSYTRNFDPRGPYQHALTLGMDIRDFQSSLDPQFDGIEGLRTDLTVRPVTLGYEGSWRTQRRQAAGAVNLVQNLRGGSHGKAEDFAANRIGAEPSYALLRYSGVFNQNFTNEWSAAVRVNGQWTNDLLVPVEFFGVGGADSVRGFYTREAGGDRGLRVSTEVFTPELAPHLGLSRSGLRLLGFVDAGRVRRDEPLPGEVGQRTLASVGLGLRFNYDRSLYLRLDGAYVLNDGDLEDADSHRLHASLSWSF